MQVTFSAEHDRAAGSSHEQEVSMRSMNINLLVKISISRSAPIVLLYMARQSNGGGLYMQS